MCLSVNSGPRIYRGIQIDEEENLCQIPRPAPLRHPASGQWSLSRQWVWELGCFGKKRAFLPRTLQSHLHFSLVDNQTGVQVEVPLRTLASFRWLLLPCPFMITTSDLWFLKTWTLFEMIVNLTIQLCTSVNLVILPVSNGSVWRREWRWQLKWPLIILSAARCFELCWTWSAYILDDKRTTYHLPRRASNSSSH